MKNPKIYQKFLENEIYNTKLKLWIVLPIFLYFIQLFMTNIYKKRMTYLKE